MYHSVVVFSPQNLKVEVVRGAGKIDGKKILLSNIGIHKEQNPLRGKYFSPDNFTNI